MPHPLLRRTDQALIATLVAAGLVILAAQWITRGGRRADLVNIERAGDLGYVHLVDANRAGWPELAQLPDIGEVLARRIVDHRERHGPYSTVDELLSVNGIGPRRLERLRGYLAPLPGEPALAGGKQ